MANLMGGWSETRAANAEILKICDQAKGQVEKKTGKNYREFKAVNYREQVVEGMNYIIKVHVGGVKYLHVFLFQALPCYGGGIEVRSVQEDKTKDDPIEPPEC